MGIADIVTPLMGDSELMTPEEIAPKRQEKDLISLVIRFYCGNHRTKAHEPLCDECAELEKYAHTRGRPLSSH